MANVSHEYLQLLNKKNKMVGNIFFGFTAKVSVYHKEVYIYLIMRVHSIFQKAFDIIPTRQPKTH